MEISAITPSSRRPDLYWIYVDGLYGLSLSADAVLKSGVYKGQQLTPANLKSLKDLAEQDQIYQKALRFVLLRTRTRAEVELYLRRKKTPAPSIEQITNKLVSLGYVDDQKFAEAFVRDRRLLRPASRRKMILELRKHNVDQVTAESAVGSDDSAEQTALKELIRKKRRLSAYRDDLKLKQYLSRQGFSYEDIKNALSEENS